jgi:deoxyribodipyrimidine photo-lyase
VPTGGESGAQSRLAAWTERVEGYATGREDLSGEGTSHLSADLHFGCISALQVESSVAHVRGAEPFVRQLCWRDFYLQIMAARPEAAWTDFVDRGWRPRKDERALEAWKQGRTGIPIVDAGMRQLDREGFVPNRVRMILAWFFTRHLELDWREGAGHFLRNLVDADVAVNNLNWQWMAGRGTGSNPHRVMNPIRQAKRFDPEGRYVRGYVEELADLGPDLIQEPWRLGAAELSKRGYPMPLVQVES